MYKVLAGVSNVFNVGLGSEEDVFFWKCLLLTLLDPKLPGEDFNQRVEALDSEGVSRLVMQCVDVLDSEVFSGLASDPNVFDIDLGSDDDLFFWKGVVLMLLGTDVRNLSGEDFKQRVEALDSNGLIKLLDESMLRLMYIKGEYQAIVKDIEMGVCNVFNKGWEGSSVEVGEGCLNKGREKEREGLMLMPPMEIILFAFSLLVFLYFFRIKD